MTDTLFYRLSMIAAVLGAVLYVANKAQWHSAPEAALTPVAAPTVVAPTASAPVEDSVPIYPTNNGASAMIDVVLGVQPLRMLLDTGATTCLISEAILRHGSLRSRYWALDDAVQSFQQPLSFCNPDT